MDYFNDVFTTFLSLGRVRILAVIIAVYQVQRALKIHPKYLNLCSEDKRHEGEILITEFSFLGELCL